jgi:aryl-alcohol dehydrogenase-like predicted oxidoreductase
MKKTRYLLGQTDIALSPIGLGCWQFSKGQGLAGGYWPSLSDEDTQAIVQASLEGGVNWFDTAEAYGNGASEASLSNSLQALQVEPGSVVVATKWMPIFRRAASVSKTIGDRVRYLDPYPIDLHQIHNPGSLSGIRAQVERMGAVLQEGRTRAIGVSNFSAKQFRKAQSAAQRMGLGIASNQMPFNLLNRKIEENGTLDAVRESGATLIAYSPLAQGLLTGKFHKDPGLIKQRPGPRRFLKRFRSSSLEKTRPLIDLLQRIAERKGDQVTAAQVALAWTVQFHGDSIVAIPGASKVSQAQSNAGALHVALTDDELSHIDRTSKQVIATL